MRIPSLQSITDARARWRWAPEGIVLFLLLVFLAAGCLARDINHDEQQFVASGALLARAGLLPYLHYPYFHLPNLVFVFAGLFSTNSFLLLTARSFNIVCAWLLLVFFFFFVLSAFRSFGEKRWPIAAAITLIFALNPIFRFAAGRAWNHDLPMLASFAAFAVLLRALQPKTAGRWMAASGALLGIAVGTRLTFLPLILPFVALIFLFNPRGITGWRAAAFFLGAMSVALLPTIALFAANPAAFFFNNFAFNGAINLSFRRLATPGNVTLIEKLLFPLRLILKFPSNLLLVIGFALFACWFPLRNGWRAALRSRETTGILMIVPFALLGALLPTPSYRQYYHAVVPFLFLGTAFGIAQFWNTPRTDGKLSRLLAYALIVGFIEMIPDLHGSGIVTRPDRWAIWKVHQTGLEIQRRAGAERVLTLAPIYPLEGGAGIYKEFCTGPFAWRLSPFASEKDQARYGLVSAANLDNFLAIKPAAILTRVEKSALEKPLVNYARKHRYTKSELPGGSILWLPPEDVGR